MASETFYSPRASVRWAHLINADEYEGKWSYSCELVLDNNNPAHQAFLAKLEQEFVAQHGAKKARSAKGEPWRADKEDPAKTVVRFKANRFTNDDGTHSKGPRIVDAKKQPWDGAAIGNGSKLVVAFDIYDWDGENGCGMTFQPRAVQVVEFVPYEQIDPTDGFEEQEGYTAGGGWVVDDDVLSLRT